MFSWEVMPIEYLCMWSFVLDSIKSKHQICIRRPPTTFVWIDKNSIILHSYVRVQHHDISLLGKCWIIYVNNNMHIYRGTLLSRCTFVLFRLWYSSNFKSTTMCHNYLYSNTRKLYEKMTFCVTFGLLYRTYDILYVSYPFFYLYHVFVSPWTNVACR